ncbi:hypothetical protein HYC85_012159 [Camellia sinensis]|uniref:Reverse transcriptase Ty1/copia-type domain-containing protein n=1 Tax=Camellia sinensis TaxID=4442 RepID=A0A7J7HEE3_CAMSI|nr:hypothetical protein HYC85_012159 [Camellia sinensis]
MFIKHFNDGKIAILIVFVDDIILTGDNVTEMDRLKKSLALEFEIKDLGSLKYFLGMEVARSKMGIVVSQRKYILDLLKETGMSGCRPVDTPIDPNQKLGDTKDGNPVDTTRYQKLVGKIDLLAKQVAEKDRMRNRTLGKAFNLIDKYVSMILKTMNLGFLNKDQCILLFEELNKYSFLFVRLTPYLRDILVSNMYLMTVSLLGHLIYRILKHCFLYYLIRTLPKISREDFELIFDELDDSHDFKLLVAVNFFSYFSFSPSFLILRYIRTFDMHFFDFVWGCHSKV